MPFLQKKQTKVCIKCKKAIDFATFTCYNMCYPILTGNIF